ncbi:ankyrin repeat domain-containing protein [Musicola keenii]|uniref:ankyrin repeat domain-containing protein n=1 Tax=Musicola keenii TaxID=2884250 RepID=UPI00177E286F|nr:ankyrin repeat domain-containing protein [Musicola keenii]
MKSILSFVFFILFSSSVLANENDNVGNLIWSGENIEVIKIINNNPKLVNVKNSNGYTLLHLASMVGNTAIVSFIISKGANVNAPDGEGYSPLTRAIANNHQDIVDILIKNGGKEL